MLVTMSLVVQWHGYEKKMAIMVLTRRNDDYYNTSRHSNCRHHRRCRRRDHPRPKENVVAATAAFVAVVVDDGGAIAADSAAAPVFVVAPAADGAIVESSGASSSFRTKINPYKCVDVCDKMIVACRRSEVQVSNYHQKPLAFESHTYLFTTYSSYIRKGLCISHKYESLAFLVMLIGRTGQRRLRRSFAVLEYYRWRVFFHVFDLKSERAKFQESTSRSRLRGLVILFAVPCQSSECSPVHTYEYYLYRSYA